MNTNRTKLDGLLGKGLITFVLLFVIWGVASLFMTADLLPSPRETFKGLIGVIERGVLLTDIYVSTVRILNGWIRGIILGIPVGLIVGKWKIFRIIIEPLVNFFRFIPAIGFLTLFLMWFGVGEASKHALICYATFFPVVVNTIAAADRIDPVRYQAASSLGANSVQTFFSVTLPSAVPGIFTGVRLGLGNAITAIVAAEMLASNDGLGYLIYTSRNYYHTDWIFVGIIILGVMGFAADRLLRFLGGRFLSHFGVEKES